VRHSHPAFTQWHHERDAAIPAWLRGLKDGVRVIRGRLQVLLEVKEYLEDDPEATSKRKRVVKRDVVMTTDCLDPLVLHWGVAQDEPGQWILAPPELRYVVRRCELSQPAEVGVARLDVLGSETKRTTRRAESESEYEIARQFHRPDTTVAVDAIACETPFYLTQGCFGAGDDECVPMQKIVITFPGTGEQYMGIQFVARKTDTDEWFQVRGPNRDVFVCRGAEPPRRMVPNDDVHGPK